MVCKYRRQRTRGAFCAARCEHVRALQLTWLHKYLDASRGPWKELLDEWLGRWREGRGAFLSTIPYAQLVSSNTGRQGALPGFWRQAIKVAKSLTLVREHPHRWEANDAKSLPFWTCPAFEVRDTRHIRRWRYALGLNTVKDLVKEDGSHYTEDEIIEYFEAQYVTNEDGDFHTRSGLWKRAEALKQWRRLVAAPGAAIMKAVTGGGHREAWRYSAQALHMMASSGWSGGGLGNDGRGINEPVQPAAKYVKPKEPREPGKAVRFVTASAARNERRERGRDVPMASKVKIAAAEKKPVFVASLREDDSIAYGKLTKEGMEEWVPSTKGILRRTDNTITHDKLRLRDIAWWDGKPVGVAESSFPDPAFWRYEGIDIALDKINVRELTRAFGRMAAIEPSCWKAWEDRIGALPGDLGRMYNTKLLTPRDWASHFKNVTHRALAVRSITTHEPCRCCGVDEERLTHFPFCEGAKEIFAEFHSLAGSPIRVPPMHETENKVWARFCLFGLLPDKRLQQGLESLLLLLWKHLIALLVRIELESETFDPKKVWAPAWIRIEKK